MLLPATTWFLMKPTAAPARTFIERGIPVALGTDFNPGTSPTAEPAAGDDGRLPVARDDPGRGAQRAVTINAAHALGIGDVVGSIEPDKQADLVVWRVPTADQIPYWPAADLVRTVIKRGRPVLQRE